MASGKTSVGRALAQSLSDDATLRSAGGWTLVDADDVIVARAGKPIHRIFSEDGEPAFRELERQVIADLCVGERQVIASGGGSFVDRAEPRGRCCRAGGCSSSRPAPPKSCGGCSEEDAGGPIRPLLAVDDPEARIAELLARSGCRRTPRPTTPSRPTR